MSHNNIKASVIGFCLALLANPVFAQQSIMVTGDSISAGFDRPSYRLPLLDELAANGCTVDMVGNQTLNSFDYRNPLTSPGSHFPGFEPGLGYDTDHQAFPGIRADQLLSGTSSPFYTVLPISAYASAEQPDFVLLHLGTNDLNVAIVTGTDTTQEIDQWANQTTSEISSVIDQIIANHNNPANLKILLGNFIPYEGPFVNQTQIDTAMQASTVFTGKLEDMVAARADTRVLIVDVATGFDVATMTTDNVHPNEIGEQHIAGAFLPVLKGAGLCPTNVPYIVSPQNGSTVNGAPLTISWDANGMPVDSWQVYVGDTQSGNSSTYLDSGVLGSGVTSVDVPSLPEDGSNVFVSLNYLSNGIWDQSITSFISNPTVASAPAITSPAPGTTLPGASATFEWVDNGTSVIQWYFRAGSTLGGEEYFGMRLTDGTQRSTVITGLPVDGSVVYVEFSHRLPNGAWVSENVQYTAFDTNGGTTNQPPVAVDDTVGPLNAGASLTFDVASNDTDSDGTVVASSVSIVGQPQFGTAVVEANGQITYTHNGAAGTGSDALTYTVLDDDGALSNSATVTITPINDPGGPLAPALTSPLPGTTLPGASATFEWVDNGTSVIQWYFRAGSTLGGEEYFGMRLTDRTQRSTVITGLPVDGSVVYVEFSHRLPNGAWVSENVQYTAFDTNGGTPNQPPVAVDDTVGPVTIGESITFSVSGNDVDSDGSVVPASVAIVDNPALGTAVVGADGQITYTHDGTPGTLQDVFTYTVLDDDGAMSNVATVTLVPFQDPDPGNQPPVAVDDTVGPLNAGASLTFDVASNDTDSDGTVVASSVSIVGQPQFGTAVVEANGQITYTHNGAAGTGSDALTYTVLDDDGALSNSATVTITPINDPGGPLAPALTSPLPGTTLPGASATFEWVDNGTSVIQWYFRAGSTLGGEEYFGMRLTDGTQRSTVITGLPVDGSVVYVEFSHRLPNGAWVSENVQYTAFDTNGGTTNQPPVAVDDTVGPLNAGASLTFDVATNDTDSDGTVVASSVSIVGQPQFGTAVVEANGQITYTHNGAAGTGSDALTYTVLDDDGALSNSATVTITPIADPDPGNQPPVAGDDTAGPMNIGDSLTFEIFNNDTDSDGSIVPASFQVVSQPQFGTVSVGSNGLATYVHTGSVAGSDSFTYTVADDGGAASNVATVSISPILTPGALPALTSPLPGTQLPGSDVNFTWTTNGVPVQQWYIRAGLSLGSTEFADIRITNPATQQFLVTGMPTDGVTPIFIEFSYRQAGQWKIRNFEYVAFDGNVAN